MFDFKSKTLPHKVFIILAAVIFILMTVFSFDGGINGDERFHVRQGESTYKWYKSFGKDKSFMVKTDQGGDMIGETTYIYGALIDMLSVLTNRVLGNEPTELGYHNVRHVIIAWFGYLGMLFAGLLAGYLLGWEAGIMVLIFMFVTPRFFGHSTFNPKDLPFASGYIMAIYFLVKFIDQVPKPATATIVGLGIGIALAINVRVGGILLIAYLGMFTTIALMLAYLKNSRGFSLKNYRPTIVGAVIASAIGYFGGLIFWPFGLMDPLSNPLQALTGFTNFHTSISMLFGGDRIIGGEVPWNYIPQWLMITTPLIILIGLIPFCYLIFKEIKDKRMMMLISIVLFALIFPIFWVVYKKSVLYDGLRHLLFTVPPLVVLCGLGWGYLYKILEKKPMKIALIALLAIGILNPLIYIVKNPTVSYTFFNPIVGGVNGAYGNYETDYYMLSVKDGAEWLIDELKDKEGEVVVATDCFYPLNTYLQDRLDNVKCVYTSYYNRNQKDWEYGVFFSRFVHNSQMDNKTWPPDNSVHNVTVGKTPLLTVVKRDSKSDFLGIQAAKKQNYSQAIPLLEQAVKEQPNNETLLRELGSAYLQSQQVDKGIQMLEKSNLVDPDQINTLFPLGVANLMKGQHGTSILLLNKVIQMNPGFAQAYNYLGQAYQAMGDQASAQKYFQRAQQLSGRK